MREKLFMGFLLVVLLSSLSSAATIHGGIYDPNYNLLGDSRIGINTTPQQSSISKDGLYFFYVPLGFYELRVEKTYQGVLVFNATQTILVDKDGEYVIDIVTERQSDIEIPGDEDQNWMMYLVSTLLFYWKTVLAVFIFIFLLTSVTYWFFTKEKKIGEATQPVGEDSVGPVEQEPKVAGPIVVKDEKEEKKPELPSTDESGFVDESDSIDTLKELIRKEGGRTTQKDIRRMIPLSEAKVSLMISELEAKGVIEKIKKGRGNIIVLKEH